MHQKKLIIISIILLNSLFNVYIVLGVVKLRTFTTTFDSVANEVHIEWIADTEDGVFKYNVLRSVNQFGVYTRINVNDIFCQGCDNQSGGSYLFDDTDIAFSTSYWYKLETVYNDQSIEFTGPISPWAPAVTSTPTATKTRTPTITFTNTITATPKNIKTKSSSNSSASTATSSGILAVQRSTTPGSSQATNTPVTPEATGTPTGAINGVPVVAMPSITLVFEATATPEVIGTPTPVAGTVSGTASWFTPRRMVFAGVMLLVWGSLGAWFFFSLRKIE